MNRCYREELTDMVVMVNEDGTRGAAEFIVNGTYLSTDEGLPEANGQTYRLPAGAFSRSATARSRASPIITACPTGSPRLAAERAAR